MGAGKKSMMKAMYGAPSVGIMIRKKFDFDFSVIFDFAEKSKIKAQLALVSEKWTI